MKEKTNPHFLPSRRLPSSYILQRSAARTEPAHHGARRVVHRQSEGRLSGDGEVLVRTGNNLLFEPQVA